MGKLAGALEAAPMRRGVPREFGAGVKLDADKNPVAASINVPADMTDDESRWRDLIKEQTGVTIPKTREVILVGVRLWNMFDHPHRHLTFKIEDRTGSVSQADIKALADLMRPLARRRPPKTSELASTRTRLIGLSDEQLGKVDKRGGTPEFFERLGLLLAMLDEEIESLPCEDAVILLGGDMVEGFQSHAGQQFTNDLSHPAQLTAAHAYLSQAIPRIASRFGRVRVAAVPSNHAAWRAGKGYLGKPGDDYGIAVVQMVASAMSMSERWAHVEFIIPSEWEISVALPVRDDVVALVHGHVGNSSPSSFDRWIDGQTSGDSVIGAATIVVNGHWHHYLRAPIGNLGDRERVRVQLPSLDGGSGHFTNARGHWSHPGIWTAIVRDGYGLDNERVLRVNP